MMITLVVRQSSERRRIRLDQMEAHLFVDIVGHTDIL